MARGKHKQGRQSNPGRAVARSNSNPERQQGRPAPSVEQRLFAVEERFEHHSGPLPHPDLLRQYELVLPGAADRIITMAERQSDHRQVIEKDVVFGNSRRANVGLALGFVIALVFGWFSYSLIMNGHTVEGTLLGSVDLVSLVGVFVYGRSAQERERRQKAKQQAS